MARKRKDSGYKQKIHDQEEKTGKQHRKRGRPKGSKNKPKINPLELELSPALNVFEESKINCIKDLENEVLEDADLSVETPLKETSSCSSILDQIIFRLPHVVNPFIGTPKQVQKELDDLVLYIQKHPRDDEGFNRIHLYIHSYLINVVLRKFPFIKGYQTVDIYQETLIALKFKAIPNFKNNRGMSFLNFAKMCIRRHLITLLNTSKTRKKDQSMNQAFSIEGSPIKGNEEGEDSSTTFANIIPDKKDSVDKAFENKEAIAITKNSLMNVLSFFEKIVLQEYLTSFSYKEISTNITKRIKKRCNTKSIDNALLRIRKKSVYVLKHCRPEDLPLFMKKR
jgi:RNA polymerase sporulation-specific sigma factor